MHVIPSAQTCESARHLGCSAFVIPAAVAVPLSQGNQTVGCAVTRARGSLTSLYEYMVTTARGGCTSPRPPLLAPVGGCGARAVAPLRGPAAPHRLAVAPPADVLRGKCAWGRAARLATCSRVAEVGSRAGECPACGPLTRPMRRQAFRAWGRHFRGPAPEPARRRGHQRLGRLSDRVRHPIHIRT